ncbi:GNAT family N-acetyltransferase [Piscirickettsia litoralis]|uniref:N-acetyltransferase domain-containing protein n=1 Tax=Piscirickettsia litoralis TaxID=1891921 RepID=A0ABX3A1X1_9GAMM|nr:GNAT family N-acetyltransferase [Piscirickettsia litoralis]ODN42495.1 hypothetical protein BGC07_05590 [Piscirickettsia litoralis]
MDEYELYQTVPHVGEYRELRRVADLSEKSLEAAEIGLKNSLYGVSIRDYQGLLIAMGRLIGDGGCFIQVTDIAVRPEHQGHGLGRRVMEALMAYIDQSIPKTAFIGLFADVPELYIKFGFQKAKESVPGMYYYNL